ncbi:3-oxoadipate enol-lactonase 2 [Labrenzia sp. THAF191b]|uniref:3-oxoadipate enol-lactonase n=2 Tax=Hyphomicrobiales TaxID=356 RepID=UPI001268A41A|nr:MULTISPECIES: 3-oxoadipate enol-lactonase [Stappiaceae]MCR9283362.1 3-oxoadipate enol-lactonase [Paracoccaceae bacterium]MBO9421616.1 3-oxoadipate enol-lactonase [Labrenzia sp. R4_2]QFS97220.1 3-oxoadipate enol-lactonase 2 [Labrenzia sp. THAF191b]QFT03535.1 3-oxoadipate enol-lactonase 2 [Labrenzia sp. THAF191a]QFT15077.1 3-oxoadipate enol-lactonase 2 [Labrenzia sp. THAF187b]
MQALTRDWGIMHTNHRSGEGSQLVFVNSLGTDLRMWDAVVAALPTDWACLRMDKRGHGLSETAPPGYGIPELASDVLAAMDQAAMDRAVIVGCSVGGLIAQHIALMAPERVDGLVLSNTASTLGAAEGWHTRIADVREHGMAAMAEGILPRWFGPKMLADNKAFLWHTLLARTCQEGYIATCAAIAGTDISDRLGEITQPTLVLGGKYDLATPPEVIEALAVNLPFACLVMFGDTGHLPAIEAPDAFTEALTQFVERISE